MQYLQYALGSTDPDIWNIYDGPDPAWPRAPKSGGSADPADPVVPTPLSDCHLWLNKRIYTYVHKLCPNNSGWKLDIYVIAPRLWNSLPPDTRNSLYLSTFRSRLKTHLSKLASPSWILSHPIHRTAYPDLILVSPLLLALSNATLGFRSLLLL